MIKVSNPSRLCLFGEHQDYLGLEVVAVAINLRFSAEIEKREDSLIKIKIRDEKLDSLNCGNPDALYQEYVIDISKEIVYKDNYDFMNSAVNVLLKRGYKLSGFDIKMDSEIPIGKGMCSSTTMVVAIIKSILTAVGHPDANDPYVVAKLAFDSEVAEFGNPGGMMDQYASALGGLVHLNFANGTEAEAINRELGGVFILFDSLERKDTLNVLSASKIPTLEGLSALSEYGVTSIRDFAEGRCDVALVDKLDEFHRRKVLTNIDNYRILKEGLALLKSEGDIDERLGELIYAHHKNLRDGLGISTPTIEKILDTALAHGAYGGKVNGSGGGGCCFAYASREKAQEIIDAVAAIGYPGKILSQDEGIRTDKEI